MANELLDVDPRLLRLPNSRREGADPVKLRLQIAKFGSKVDGMPPALVTRGKEGHLMILDGVTRATRVAMLLPGESIRVEVVDDSPKKNLSRLPTVGDSLP